MLEAKAERRLTRTLTRQGVRGRVNLLEDSRVTLLSGAKGRPSSTAIRGQLCLSLPYQLGGGLCYGRHYAPSKLMPADYPSRNRDLPPPSGPRPAWWGHAAATLRLRRWLRVPPGCKPFADWARLLLLLEERDERLWFVGAGLGRKERSNTAGDGPPRVAAAAARPGSTVRTASLPVLPDRKKLAPATLALRDRCLWDFSVWLLTIPGAPDLPSLVSTPLELNGRALFRFGRPRGDYVNTVLSIIDLRRELRRQLSPALDFAELWRSFFPGWNRVALGELILKAMCTQALCWGWLRTAAAGLRHCFYGMLRPAEFLKARRKDLVLAPDLCRDPYTDLRMFLGIVSTKTRTSGARHQHARSDDRHTAWLWSFLASGAAPEEPLWSLGSAVFRARWNVLCRSLKIPHNTVSGVTPGSLRGGGASALYDTTEDIELVRHRGRWSSAKMVEIYVQEVGGHLFLASLPQVVRERLFELAALEHEALELALSLLQSQTPVEDFPHIVMQHGLPHGRKSGRSG